MKLLITGASGFLGAATVRAALLEGHEITATVRPGGSVQRLREVDGHYQRIEIDLRDSDAVAKAMIAVRPDVVLHLAWWGVANSARFDHGQVSENIHTACTLTEAAASAGANAFVGLGSQGEYGSNVQMCEDSLPQPTSLYGASKVATLFLTRQIAAQSALRHAWLRLFSTYGPNDNDVWLIPTLIKEMLAGRRPKTTLGTQMWDWLYVDDAARAILAVASSETASGVFNLGSGRAVAVRSAVERIRDLVAPEMELVFGEIPFRPDQVMHMCADITRLRSATGWKPSVEFKEGIAETVAWYRSQAI